MASTNLNIRVDKEIKENAEAIFAELGINMSSAINIFLRKVIRDKGLPFSVTIEEPNKKTIKAIKQGQKIINDDNTPSYDTIDELKKALDV